MTTDLQHESNIFGDAIITSGGIGGEPSNNETTAAGKLIAHLKFVADDAIAQAENRADWLALAAKSGQNGSTASFARREYTQPDKILSSGIVNGWVLPKLPDLLTLPNLPSALTIDPASLKGALLTDVNDLKNSWLAQFLPSVTDVSALNGMVSSILDGSAQRSFETRLNTLETAITAALGSISTSAQALLTTQVATSQGNVTANIAAMKTYIAAALATAIDNTQTIAWNRARDQAAREGKRLEDDALSSWASRGFSLPGGVVAAQIQQRRQATLSAAVDAAALQAEKQQTFNIEIARETISSWERTMEIQNRAEVDSYRAIVETNIKFGELQVDANKFNADLAVKHLGLTLDFSKFAGDLAVKYRLGVASALNELIRAYAGLRGAETDNIRTIATVQQQAVGALVEYYRAAMQSATIGLDIEKTNTDTALRYIATAAQFIGTAVGHHVQAAAAAAEVFSRTAGMALSGLNGTASVASSA